MRSLATFCSAAVAAAATLFPAAAADPAAIRAELYNPPAKTAYDDLDAATGKPKIAQLGASLVLRGEGLPDGKTVVAFKFDAAACGDEQKTPVTVRQGRFERQIDLARPCPAATNVRWRIKGEAEKELSGVAPLAFARFSGRVVYRDGKQRPTYILLNDTDFGTPGFFHVPVADDGRFDARVPARIYNNVIVNSSFFAREALERWAWEYDLTRDREETFTVGRMEIYSMHAFELIGGQPLVFVTFRPSTLSRVLAFDANGDGFVDQNERKAMSAAMKKTPTAIGPELKAENVKVWLDGVPQPVARVDLIPEANADGFWQVEYLVQITPKTKPERGVRHEVRVEVESNETLRGAQFVDYGQGSTTFFRP